MLKIAMSEISRLFDAIQAVDELYLPVEKGNLVFILQMQRCVLMHFRL